MFSYFFFNDTATTEIYTLSLHDALPICAIRAPRRHRTGNAPPALPPATGWRAGPRRRSPFAGHWRSEETSELQSRQYLVCRLLLEKKKKLIRKYEIRDEGYYRLVSVCGL